MISKYYLRILVVLAISSFFTNLSSYLFATEKVSTPPLHWIIAFGIGAVPFCISRQSLFHLHRSGVALWCFGFLMISGVWLLFQPRISDIEWQELDTRILSVIFLLILICIFSRKDAQVWGRYAIFAAGLLAVALNVYEFFHPATFSLVIGRSAGLYTNPNQSGAALILGMILSVGLLRHRHRMPFLVLIGIGVFLTLSRAAIIGWLLTTFVIIKTGQVSLKRSLAVTCTLLAITFSVVVWQWDKIEDQLENIGGLNASALTRLNWHDSMDRSDFSSTERKEVAERAWHMFSDSPIIGHGVGTSVDWGYERSSHNEYLSMMVDHGVLGFFILPLSILAVIWRARGEARLICIAFALFLSYWGSFSHNVFTERYILTVVALLSAMTITSRSDEAEKKIVQPSLAVARSCIRSLNLDDVISK